MASHDSQDELTAVAGTPLLLRVEEAAKRLDIGRTTLYGLVMTGEIESVLVGRSRRIPAECLDEYVQRLRAESRPLTSEAA